MRKFIMFITAVCVLFFISLLRRVYPLYIAHKKKLLDGRARVDSLAY